MDPEHRRPDQQVTQGPSADAGHDCEEDEGHQRLPLLGCEERARDREHRDSEIGEQHEGGRNLRRHRHAPYISGMAEDSTVSGMGVPTLEDWQHWTLVMGRVQQMLMEFWAEGLKKDQPFPSWSPGGFGFGGEP